MSQTAIAAVLLIVGIIMVLAYLRYKSATSRSRMTRMLLRVGLDPELVRGGDTEAIMKEVRKRCSRCQTEDLCERWLADKAQGGNEFCPNAEVFEELKRV